MLAMQSHRTQTIVDTTYNGISHNVLSRNQHLEATTVLVGVCKCKLRSHIHVLDQIQVLAELIDEVHSKFSRIRTIGKIFHDFIKCSKGQGC